MMSKKISVGHNLFAIVDDENYEELNKYHWYLNAVKSNHRYAIRRSNGKQILMHRIINNTPEGFHTDHVNHNTLDNRKSNLRTVTSRVNQLNRKGLQPNNTSGIQGVSWHKPTNKWAAYGIAKKKMHHLGLFENKEEAGAAVAKFKEGLDA